MKAKIGDILPYFEYLEGVYGKSFYDLRQKHHVVIYNSSKIDLSDYEDALLQAGVKVIDYIQILTKDFLDKLDIKDKDEFLIIADRYGIIQSISEGDLPDYKQILETVQLIDDEGCCAL
ncbi:MAG TPA: hypothetical protein EYH43_00220 [Persephonella sp.]|nr:hypothetical protein [Hydrogenothermaceae bacterium]HIQ24392.1 hypothetical protein [Persephonella sp.]